MSETKEAIGKPDLNELAAAAQAPGAPQLDALAEPGDPILKQRGGGDYKIYREILRDDQVKATFEQRKLAVVSAEWEVEAGAEDAASAKAADFMREQLHNAGWDRITNLMLNGVFYGYAVAECMWKIGGLFEIDNIIVRQHSRFRYDGGRRLRLINGKDLAGALLPERKFWHYCTGAEHDDEPYGLGLGHWLYWPVYFKRQGLAFWLTFLDKLAIPITKGHYDPGASQTEKDTLLKALASIRTNSAIIVPKGVEIGLLEAARSATPDYSSLIDKMNAAISKIVLGQTMTTDDGSSKSQAQVHQDVRADLVTADADLICESWNRGPGLWLTEWNFPGAAPPRVYRRTEETEDLDKLAERDERVHGMGFRPTLDRVISQYGEGWEPAAPPATQKTPPQPGATAAAPASADLADTPPRDTVDELADQVDQLAGAMITAEVDKIRKLLDDCEDLPQFAERLVELYPDKPAPELGRLMQQAIALAGLQGRAEFADGV